MPDSNNAESIKLTEAQLQDLVTQVLNHVNTRIDERLVDTVNPGDNKHIPTSAAVSSAIPVSLPANGGHAETAEKMSNPRTINGVEFNGEEDIKVGILRSALHNPTPQIGWFKALSGSLTKVYHNFIKGLFLVTGDSFIQDAAPAVRGNGLLTIGLTTHNAAHNYEIQYSSFSIDTNTGSILDPDRFKLFLRDDPEDSTAYEIEVWVKMEPYSRVSFICLEYPEMWTFSSSNVAGDLPDENEWQYWDCTKFYSSEVADLKGYIGYTDNDVYGLEADFENKRFTRLAGAVGKNPGADFDGIRAFGGRKRCALKLNGEVYAYFGEDAYEDDGFINSIKAHVYAMVEQPKFYYKVVPLKTEKIEGADGYHLRKARYYISDTPKPGFKVHPAFVQDGREVDKIYLSAYEGSLYHINGETTADRWCAEDEQTADFNVDKLYSYRGAKPASGNTQYLTRDNARKLAQNNGAGWGITTIQTLSATQLLFAIEYATFNSQTAIGAGISTKALGSGNESEKTGATSSLGNVSGSVGSGAVSYRGEENLWGNIMHFVDNCILNVDDSNYLQARINEYTLPVAKISGGYISAFSYNSIDWCFLASECLGNSVLPIGDISYAVPADANTNEVVFCAGGDWYHGGANGLYEAYAQWSTNTHARMGGARLIYIPRTSQGVNE